MLPAGYRRLILWERWRGNTKRKPSVEGFGRELNFQKSEK